MIDLVIWLGSVLVPVAFLFLVSRAFGDLAAVLVALAIGVVWFVVVPFYRKKQP